MRSLTPDPAPPGQTPNNGLPTEPGKPTGRPMLGLQNLVMTDAVARVAPATRRRLPCVRAHTPEGECIPLYTVDRCRAVYCRPLYTAVELYTSASGAGRCVYAVYRYTTRKSCIPGCRPPLLYTERQVTRHVHAAGVELHASGLILGWVGTPHGCITSLYRWFSWQPPS